MTEKVKRASKDEKRHNARYNTKTLVSITYKGKRARGKTLNISNDGALIHAEGLNPRKNDTMALVFIIKLNNGRLLKLHYRDALVCHITAGNIGVLTGRREKKS